jgi:hypothetical protein
VSRTGTARIGKKAMCNALIHTVNAMASINIITFKITFKRVPLIVNAIFIDNISSTIIQYKYFNRNTIPDKAAMKINSAINKLKNAARKIRLL